MFGGALWESRLGNGTRGRDIIDGTVLSYRDLFGDGGVLGDGRGSCGLLGGGETSLAFVEN